MVWVFRQQQCDYSASTRLMKSLWDLALAGHCCQTAQKNQVPLCSSQCLTFAHVPEMPYVVVAAPPSVCRDKKRAARAFLKNFCIGSIPEVLASHPIHPQHLLCHHSRRFVYPFIVCPSTYTKSWVRGELSSLSTWA